MILVATIMIYDVVKALINIFQDKICITAGKRAYYIEQNEIIEMLYGKISAFKHETKDMCTLNFDNQHLLRISGYIQHLDMNWYGHNEVNHRRVKWLNGRVGWNGLRYVPIAIPKLSTGRKGHGCTRTVYKGKPAILVAGGTSFEDGNDAINFHMVSFVLSLM